ncbi:hypothetical protein SAMN02787079_02622 [Lysinibacillus sp. TC-37]|nr:hypothetical protein SAMN02787078_02294 [Lysinibacillus sp. SG9]SDB35021.1 hypothetical protein SAMN02787079_02622 [Lysinibacillus sp. TC-37]SFS97976.1 hypothetical protein SAMN02787087_02906 [Lysinibacillus sp. SG55]
MKGELNAVLIFSVSVQTITESRYSLWRKSQILKRGLHDAGQLPLSQNVTIVG